MTQIDELAQKVDYLQDLFQRKLLEDKAKNQLIQSVQESLLARDAEATGAVFRDLFIEALVAVDRLRTEEVDTHLVDSVVDELLEVFARRGLQPVPATGALDPRIHEVIDTVPLSGDRSDGEIVHVHQDGFVLGERLLRPAKVVIASAARTPSP